MCWHQLPVPHESHIPSRQACGKGIGLPSFDVQSFSRRTGTGLIGINPGDNDVLACRQVATVVSALGKASHVLAIDGHDKAKIGPKVGDPINKHMT